MHGRAVRLAHRTDGLPNLRGVAQHKVGGHRRDTVVGPEHGFQVDTQVVAEPRFELAHDSDIGSAEPVDRLPVVADGEELGVGGAVQQRLEQPRPRRGDILELVDHDVSERTAVAPRLHQGDGPVDHVVKIDRAGAGQRFLVALEYRPEHGQERFRPLAVGEGRRTLGDFCEGQPGALEVLQERSDQSRERVDPALLFEHAEQVVPGDRREGDAMGAELFRQVAQQVAIGVLVAEGLDQHGAVLFMDPALPIHLTVILVVVDERRGIALGIEPEMLDVDAVLGRWKSGWYWRLSGVAVSCS